MCLEKLSDFKINLDENGIGEGWKIFTNYLADGELRGEWKSRQKARETNKWLKEGNFRAKNDKFAKKIPSFFLSEEYPFGFHVFLTKYGAEKWGGWHIKKVKFKKVVATGLQGNCRCVVTKEIFIPK